MVIWDKAALDAPHTQREMGDIPQNGDTAMAGGYPDTDLTDPDGEAEALRRENARLLAALAASRAPDPVVNAVSCQPGDLISRAEAQRWISDSIRAVMGCIDLRAEEEAAAILWLGNFGQAIRALPAAPVAEAQPVEWRQTGVRDRHGRMICVGDRLRIDLTSPATKREYWQPEYIVEWKPPAFKLRYVGGDKDSDTAQWRFSTTQPDSLEIISQRPPVQPIGGAELDALVARLRKAESRLSFQSRYMDDARAVLDAITALRANDKENYRQDVSSAPQPSDLAKMKGE